MEKKNKLFCLLLAVAFVVITVFACGCDAIQQSSCQHEFSGDYLDVYCHKGCGASQRPQSLRSYDSKFVYDFDSSKQDLAESAYQAVLEQLIDAEPYDQSKHAFEKDGDYYKQNKAFETNYYDKFTDQLEYITEQYQYAYVFYCRDNGANGTKQNYEFVSQVRNRIVTGYYELFERIYQTQYREFFFSEEDGWTEDDIQVALNLSKSYGNSQYMQLNNEIDKLTTTYRAFSDSQLEGVEMENLYKQYVVKKNQLAALANNGSTTYTNYVDYAYRNEYERDYTPNDVAKMRTLVQTYIVPLMDKLVEQYVSPKYNSMYLLGSNKQSYNALCQDSIFDSDKTLDYVGKYFAKVNSATLGSKDINYYSVANQLFKDGNYYTGQYEGAFSYYVPAQETTILYFGADSYSSAFTFVHEFGHYYNNVYNPAVSLSMDHDETQSQGNEMLFLSYLKGVLGQDSRVYGTVRTEQLFNMVATVLMSTAVDEFEQTVYSIAANETLLAQTDLQSLFERIMNKYGVFQMFDSNYWRWVVVDSPCYYISYAMSALPSMGIFAKAEQDGFDAAKDSYLKLYTFSDQPTLAHKAADGSVVVDATYDEILHFAGLYGAFDTQLYTLLSATI